MGEAYSIKSSDLNWGFYGILGEGIAQLEINGPMYDSAGNRYWLELRGITGFGDQENGVSSCTGEICFLPTEELFGNYHFFNQFELTDNENKISHDGLNFGTILFKDTADGETGH